MIKDHQENIIEDDLTLRQQVEKLHQLTIYGRWILIAICWLTLVPWGLWQLRETISLCQEYCTWAAVRLSLEFNLWGSFALTFTVAFTTSVLVWQSSHILRGGLSAKEKYYLAEKVKKIRQQGQKNLLWYWLKNI
jgi:hypothetical protein